MADAQHIRNPIEWVWDHVADAAVSMQSVGHALLGSAKARNAPLPKVRRIGVADVRDALAKGIDDFEAYRSDVIFLVLVYPVIGLLLAWLTVGNNALPLLFPLASGFVLIGPVAGLGLYEMSRRREKGTAISWGDAFGVVHAPAFGAAVLLGLGLLGIFALWLSAAYAIFYFTLGPEPPVSVAAFASDVFTTTEGWWMIVAGMGVGFLFAVLVLTISVVSFPMLLDRDVGLYRAVITSVRAVAKNPVTMAVWGLVVAVSLAIGSLPAFIGLIVVMPVLGHATWHLYRKVVV
ncbi:DUF2189 domain-containing protein [Methyloceanibacter caenitepidi]|uniref:Mlr8238 protein n=1 Tax=Methyloceanibacter caenitepidi TaxID=1384459 RepID=A0A0A8K191_9HYPH|nr:DUF2189 domain-containing protein [Methyloceanibacter caenitepidi]BAQ16733.1 Mlr8238 protein [Methyloceanibacter caenitepidi]